MSESEKKTRVAALVGPFSSGKTAVYESLLSATGAVNRKGTANEANRVGEASEEAKKRQMSVESVFADTTYLGDPWTFVDTPGSIEFLQDSYNAAMGADVAVVVVDPDPSRAVMATPIFKFLSQRNIPHMVFINKVENTKAPVVDVLNALQDVSDRKLVLRELPIRRGEEIEGFVDLTSERAYAWGKSEYQGNVSQHLDSVPEDLSEDTLLARQEMLESIADFNDELLEKLLEDDIPPIEEIYADMAEVFDSGGVVPVFFGSAEADSGIKRLLKALRHATPEVEQTAARLGISTEGTNALVLKTYYAQHTGKQSVVRMFSGNLSEGEKVAGEKPSGLYSVFGEKTDKISSLTIGQIGALGRVDSVHTGDLLTETERAPLKDWPAPPEPVFAYALKAAKKGEEVKLSGGLSKLVESDPSLSVVHDPDTGEMCLWGQGDMHMKVAMSRLEQQFNVAVEGQLPQVPYKETIKKKTSVQGRHKKQSGGAGQFGDVHVEIRPRPRGAGFEFENSIVGGAVPKQYIPAVEQGVKEFMKEGPLGFPMVDLAVNLYDGSSHSVDSSEQAFKMAGILAMRNGVPQCAPTLLEPILSVEVSMPTEWTSHIQRILSQKRGQIFGFDSKEGWEGWDVVKASLPQAEMYDLIIELRSMTMGVGTFSWKFDHMQELTGREAEQVIEARKADKEEE